MDANLESALLGLWGSDRPSSAADGASVAESLRRLYGIEPPEDFASYLAEAAPADDWMDLGGIVWWRPGRIVSLYELYGAEGLAYAHPDIAREARQYLVFADYLDWCGYGYAICCSDGANRGRVALIDKNPMRFVALSFLSFVGQAAEDSIRLHSPGGDRLTEPV